MTCEAGWCWSMLLAVLIIKIGVRKAWRVRLAILFEYS